MAQFSDFEIVQYSRDRKRSLGKADIVSESWGKLKDRFANPLITQEKRKEYNALDPKEKGKLKSLPGWLCGALLRDGVRRKNNADKRLLITLDIDDCPVWLMEDILDGKTEISDFAFACHSTRSHTPDAPRLRIVIPCSRYVTPDEYMAIVRYVAWLIDEQMLAVSIETFRTVQVMFFPSISYDDEKNYIFYENHGEAFDVDWALDEIDRIFGDWDDFANLPRRPDEKKFHERAAKAADPLDKTGIVGAFCRAHPDMVTFIAEYLDDIYEPADDGSRDRFMKIGSSGAPAAAVYEGVFLYSNHGTDIAEGMLCNVFDLHRIHRFSHLDKDEDDDTPMVKLPSFKAMVDFAKSDKPTKAILKDESFNERLHTLGAFDGVDEDHVQERRDSSRKARSDQTPDRRDDRDEHRSGPDKRKRKDPKYDPDWIEDLQTKLVRDVEIVEPTVHNFVLLIKNDPRLWQALGYNELREQVVLVRDFDPELPDVDPIYCRDRVNGDNWSDHMTAIVSTVLGAEKGKNKGGWGVKPAQIELRQAIDIVARQNRFHPFCDMCEDVEWDGKRRVPFLFVDYLGEPDSPYARETATNLILASIERSFNPGAKFDFMPVLMGPQGIRKSTFIQELYGDEFFGEYSDALDDPKKFVEGTLGRVAVELSEIASMTKSSAEDTKSLLRNTKYLVRMAYAHNAEEFLRRCVLWGSTNGKRILKDPTGNRSFWIIYCSVSQIDTPGLIRERDQIWAEGYHLWKQARLEKPRGTLPLYLHGEAHDEQLMRANTGMIPAIEAEAAQEFLDWLDLEKVAKDVFDWYDADRKRLERKFEGDPDKIWVRRNAFTYSDLTLVLTKNEKRSMQIQSHDILTRIVDTICDAGWEKPTGTSKRFGISARWYIRKGTSHNKLGYSVVDAPDDDDFENEAL